MSNSPYTVKTNIETMESIAAKFNISPAILQQTNSRNLLGRELLPSGFFRTWAGDSLIIPDPTIAEALTQNTPDNIDAVDQNEITILIAGTQFSTWQIAEIVRSFDTIADTFTLTGPFDPDDPVQRNLFRPFSYLPVSIYIGGEKIIEGTILNHNPQGSADAVTIRISGYSKTGVLADCTLPATSTGYESNGLNIIQIAQSLAQPYGITAVANEPVGPAFTSDQFVDVEDVNAINIYGTTVIRKTEKVFVGGDKVDIAPDEIIYEYLIKLARQRQLVISSNRLGQLVIQTPTINPAIDTIIGGEPPFVKSSSKYRGQNRFNSITALGINVEAGAGEPYAIIDPAIQKTGIFRSLTFKAKDTNKGNLGFAAVAQYGRQLAEAFDFKVTVNGWRRPSDNKLWEDNTILTYQNKFDMIYVPTNFLIRNVKYVRTPKSELTELTLVFPESYNGQKRANFPWD